MDRQKNYFRQRVQPEEQIEIQDYTENSIKDLTTEILGTGFLSGGGVSENSPADNTYVLVDQSVTRDIFGNRLNIQDQIADKASSIVLGLTLQIDGIGVPSTVGTYILLTSAPGVSPFTLVGRKIKLNRSPFSGTNSEFTIQQIVTSTWGGLIPSQIMIRIDEELDQEGYTSGLAPTGTNVIVRVTSADASKANAVTDELAQDVKPTTLTFEKWVSLYARFSRIQFDERIDGNAQVVKFEQVESFKFIVDASEPEAASGFAVKPTLRTNGDRFVADILLRQGQLILNTDIDTARQEWMMSLPSGSEKIFQFANAKFFQRTITWNGTTLATSATMYFSLPNRTILHSIPVFTFALLDGDVIYVQIRRDITIPGTFTAVKTTRGSVPEGDDRYLTIELAARVGTEIFGPAVGSLLASRAGIVAIADGSDQVVVVFTSSWPDTAYVVNWDVENTIDSDPIFLSGYIKARTVSGFTIKFNAPMDSVNYKLNYSVKEQV